MVEFDRKLLSPDPRSPPGVVRLVTLSKTFWLVVLAVYAAYYAAFRVYFGSFYTASFVQRSHMVHEPFMPPEPIVFVVTATACFYLRSLGDRFRALDGMWRGQSSSPTAASAERVRLLHAELSGLLRSFSSGYGPVLLVYFAFTVAHAMFETFLLTIVVWPSFSALPYIFMSQHVVYMLSVLGFTSWVIEMVKYFMHQISIHEPNELTAFGFFNHDLKLVMSVLVLLITSIATLVQMKEHPLMIYLNNAWTLHLNS